jgi:HlyD family secretion protein
MNMRSSNIGRWLRRAAQVVVVIGIVAAIIYWLKFSPVAVKAHQLERGQIVAEVMGTGTLEARVRTSIGPKISGRIAEIRVDQNDTVSAGDLLFRLDDEELKQQEAIAEANVASEKAAIERLKADRERATAVATQARKQHTRVQTLIEKNASTQEDLDKSTEALNVAVAGLAHAEAAINEGQRQLISAEKTLEYHRARLADTKVVAPFKGLIVRRHRDPGDVVVPGSAVLSLIDTTEIWVSAWVDETEMAKLEPNQPARVVFRSEPDKSYPGKVIRLGREADRETREFVVDVRVLELSKNWAVGQRAEVYIETSRKESVTLLPAQYVVWREDTAGVFVSEGGQAFWRSVKTGLRNPQIIEVMEGVQPDDVVVAPVDPRSKLTHRRRVSIPWILRSRTSVITSIALP